MLNVSRDGWIFRGRYDNWSVEVWQWNSGVTGERALVTIGATVLKRPPTTVPDSSDDDAVAGVVTVGNGLSPRIPPSWPAPPELVCDGERDEGESRPNIALSARIIDHNHRPASYPGSRKRLNFSEEKPGTLPSDLSQFGTCVKTLTRAWVGG